MSRRWVEGIEGRACLQLVPTQTERVEMGIESQVGRNALHRGDDTALATGETTCFEASPIPAEYRVQEQVLCLSLGRIVTSQISCSVQQARAASLMAGMR